MFVEKMDFRNEFYSMEFHMIRETFLMMEINYFFAHFYLIGNSLKFETSGLEYLYVQNLYLMVNGHIRKKVVFILLLITWLLKRCSGNTDLVLNEMGKKELMKKIIANSGSSKYIFTTCREQWCVYRGLLRMFTQELIPVITPRKWTIWNHKVCK